MEGLSKSPVGNWEMKWKWTNIFFETFKTKDDILSSPSWRWGRLSNVCVDHFPFDKKEVLKTLRSYSIFIRCRSAHNVEKNRFMGYIVYCTEQKDCKIRSSLTYFRYYPLQSAVSTEHSFETCLLFTCFLASVAQSSVSSLRFYWFGPFG